MGIKADDFQSQVQVRKTRNITVIKCHGYDSDLKDMDRLLGKTHTLVSVIDVMFLSCSDGREFFWRRDK